MVPVSFLITRLSRKRGRGNSDKLSVSGIAETILASSKRIVVQASGSLGELRACDRRCLPRRGPRRARGDHRFRQPRGHSHPRALRQRARQQPPPLRQRRADLVRSLEDHRDAAPTIGRGGILHDVRARRAGRRGDGLSRLFRRVGAPVPPLRQQILARALRHRALESRSEPGTQQVPPGDARRAAARLDGGTNDSLLCAVGAGRRV